jgi:UMF1 family MFS transporter
MTPDYSVKEQRAWYAYDWANSAFYTTAVTVFLGPYLTALAKGAADAQGNVSLAGLRIPAQSIWPYAVSLSVLTQVIALPLFGALADYGRRKRELLTMLAFTGASATALMYFLGPGKYEFGCLLFLAANFTFGASIVIYNSFLPEIAAPADRDRVSSTGWGLGYLGGGILLALNLMLFSQASSLGIEEGHAVRISLASAGIWWALFTIPAIAGLRNRGAQRRPPPGQTMLGASARQLLHTFHQVRSYPHTLLFLVAYLIYNDGIQTVIAMAAQFGHEELKLSMQVLTSAILLTQFVAFFGAMGFERLSRLTSSKSAVIVSLVIWAAVLIWIYGGVHTSGEFYAAAAIIGTVLGGSQALSRSIFSLLVPKGQEAEYFAIYEISDKGTSWLGPLLLGLALHWTGSFRLAILSLIVFFVTGIVLLALLDLKRGCAEVGNSIS